MEIYRRIPLTRELDKDEAGEHISSPIPAAATFPFSLEEQGSSQTAFQHLGEAPAIPGASQETTARASQTIGRVSTGTAATKTSPGCEPGPSRMGGKDKKRKGKNRTFDSPRIKKYGGDLDFPYVEREIKEFVDNHSLLKNCPKLSTSLISLISGSMARHTWQKYKSAWRIWSNFKKEMGLSQDERFSAAYGVEFTCWCSALTKLSATTISQYVGALNKIEELVAGLRGEEQGESKEKLGKSELQKTLLRGLKNLREKPRPKGGGWWPWTSGNCLQSGKG
jgi:hypothetical protein